MRDVKQLLLKADSLLCVLRLNGYPVSDAHWKNASGNMSVEARSLHLAAQTLRQEIDLWYEDQ